MSRWAALNVSLPARSTRAAEVGRLIGGPFVQRRGTEDLMATTAGEERAKASNRRLWLAGSVALLVLSFAIISYLPFAPSKSLEVTATAYTSRVSETSGDPYTAAWNNKLTPGEKSIAVSRDLLKRGLTNGVEVKIEGLPGIYTIRDKMNKRWKRRIDIYMGNDLERAREWGKQEVVLRW